MRQLLLAISLLFSPLIFCQEQNQSTKISVTELPPEAIPAGTCKQSYSGYLEIPEHGKAKDKGFTSRQIGDYIKRRLSEGYSLALYPQASGRLFIIETCESAKF